MAGRSSKRTNSAKASVNRSGRDSGGREHVWGSPLVGFGERRVFEKRKSFLVWGFHMFGVFLLFFEVMAVTFVRFFLKAKPKRPFALGRGPTCEWFCFYLDSVWFVPGSSSKPWCVHLGPTNFWCLMMLVSPSRPQLRPDLTLLVFLYLCYTFIWAPDKPSSLPAETKSTEKGESHSAIWFEVQCSGSLRFYPWMAINWNWGICGENISKFSTPSIEKIHILILHENFERTCSVLNGLLRNYLAMGQKYRVP